MAFGAEAFLPSGEKVLSTYKPYNFLKIVPIVASRGTHSFTVSELPAGSTLEVSLSFQHPRGPSLGVSISSVSISGNRVTYTVSNTNAVALVSRGVWQVFARRF